MREFGPKSQAVHTGYSLDMSSVRHPWASQPRAGAFGIALLIFALAVLTSVIPVSNISAHNVLHHLNFLPLMIAGILFGLRGALLASIFAVAVNLPLILRQWIVFPIDAKDQIVEMGIFTVAGLIAGYLSDRERSHRRNLERTQEQLQQVYLELRENIAAMNKAERLSAVGQLAASLAHEIRNPLASISGAAGILQRGSAQPEYLEDSLSIIQKESQRLNKLLTNFLNFAKPRSPRVQMVNANELLVSVISLASHAAEKSDIKLIRTSTLQDEIACDPEQMKQVLLNLVINAIEASPAGSEIRLTTLANGGSAMIEVDDCGGGISDDLETHIFEPFFTTKAQGTGLGLAISSMIVAQHGGRLSFVKNARGGTTMRVELPAPLEPVHAC
jgi:signal transduction histidine kinase